MFYFHKYKFGNKTPNFLHFVKVVELYIKLDQQKESQSKSCMLTFAHICLINTHVCSALCKCCISFVCCILVVLKNVKCLSLTFKQ